MTDTPSAPAKKDKVQRQNPDDPKSEPVRDFANYVEAIAQADALGGKADDVTAIGTAFHVGTDE